MEEPADQSQYQNLGRLCTRVPTDWAFHNPNLQSQKLTTGGGTLEVIAWAPRVRQSEPDVSAPR